MVSTKDRSRKFFNTTDLVRAGLNVAILAVIGILDVARAVHVSAGLNPGVISQFK